MQIKSYLKYIPWVILVLAVGALAFSQWREAVATRKLLTAQNTELMKANLDIGRAHTKIVDQAALHKTALADIDSKWKAEIKKRQALVTMYAQLEGRYEAEKKKGKLVTKIVHEETLIGLPKEGLWKRDGEGYMLVTSMPFSYKDFRIDITGDAIKQQIGYKLHQRFHLQFVETKLPTGGRNHYAKLFELDDKGKRVGELKLDKFEVLRSDEMESHIMWWNPKLDLGVGFGMSHKIDFNWVAELGFSLSAYGKTLDDISWRFFRVGTGITKHGFSLSFSPTQFNLGKHLPLISNAWLMPYGGYDFGHQAGHFGLGLSVVF